MTTLGGSPKDSVQVDSLVACTRSLEAPKENNMLNNLCTESSVITNLGDSLKSTEVERKDIDPDFSMEGLSVKTDATVKDANKESPAVTDFSSSQRSAEVSLTKQKRDNVVELRDVGPDSSLEGSSGEADALIKDLCKDSLALNDLSSSQKSVEVSSTKQKGVDIVELKNVGSEFSLEYSLVETKATEKDPCKNSPTMTDSSSAQISAEVSLTMSKKRKTWSTRHNAIVSNTNGIVVLKDTFSNETSVPALHILPLHPVTRNSHAGSSFYQEENIGKEKNMLENAAETSNARQDLQEVSCRPGSDVTTVEHPVKESGPEVVNLNMVQGTIDNSFNPESYSGCFQHSNPNKKLKVDGINSGCSSSVNCDEESIIEVDKKDDLNKIDDDPLMIGLLEKEILRDQVTSKEGASEETTLMTKNMGEQKVQLEEDNGRKLEGNQMTRLEMSSVGDITDTSLVSKKGDHSKISHFSLDKTIISHPKKKLLVLDVNGLLADFVEHVPRGFEPHTWISRKSVFKRPFCDDFLKFCFDKFHVGIWSSRHKNNVDAAIEFLMGKSASKLLFCWNQSHCTMTDFTTIENRDKPLVLKELRKLWEKLEPSLPWEKGDFNESNTLLLDDSPHKALLNPKNTAIFPYSYHFRDVRDSSLGPGGDLRVYLEGLAMAEKVPEYVASNPFGQRAITEKNPSWRYYLKVINSVNDSSDSRTSSCC